MAVKETKRGERERREKILTREEKTKKKKRERSEKGAVTMEVSESLLLTRED